MADHVLLPYIRAVLAEHRETAGVQPYVVGAAGGIDPSSIARFESSTGLGWPTKMDLMVIGYATACGVAPVDLWSEALERMHGASAQGGGDPLGLVPPGSPLLPGAPSAPRGGSIPGPTASKRRRSPRLRAS
jgi:hypothetical protein